MPETCFFSVHYVGIDLQIFFDQANLFKKTTYRYNVIYVTISIEINM